MFRRRTAAFLVCLLALLTLAVPVGAGPRALPQPQAALAAITSPQPFEAVRGDVAISGTAGLAVEMVRLFQTELEHYEKLEGTRLSLDGKATYLARLVRQQLPMVFQGLVVVPIFAGFDEASQEGRLYTFDVVGGRYEEQDFGATGSGGRDAKSFLRSAYRDGLDEPAALDVALRALIAASEEDTATGGPDTQRGIFPNVATVTSEGFREVADEQVAEISAAALEALR